MNKNDQINKEKLEIIEELYNNKKVNIIKSHFTICDYDKNTKRFDYIIGTGGGSFSYDVSNKTIQEVTDFIKNEIKEIEKRYFLHYRENK